MDSGPLALLRRLQRLPSLPLGLPFAVRFRRLDDRLLARPHLQSEHTHSEHELMLSLRGVYTCRIDGHPLRIPAGGAIAVQPGDRHQDDTATPVIFRAICFDLLPGPRPGVSASLLRAGTPPGIRAIARAPALYDLAARLERSERVGGGAASLLQDALCAELVTQLAALLPLDCLAPALATRLAQAGFGQDLLDLFARHPATPTADWRCRPWPPPWGWASAASTCAAARSWAAARPGSTCATAWAGPGGAARHRQQRRRRRREFGLRQSLPLHHCLPPLLWQRAREERPLQGHVQE